MIEEILKNYTDPYYKIPSDVYTDASKYFIKNTFKKNEIIKHSNRPETHLHLITKGSSANFIYKEGHDVCIDLFYEGDFTGDYYSLINQYIAQNQNFQKFDMDGLYNKESPIFVMALEVLETLTISKDNLFKIYQLEFGEKVARMIAEVLYLQKQNQQIELLTLTAEERYKRLLLKQPDILQKTANKHIASYLGITPESFSRMRKKITG